MDFTVKELSEKELGEISGDGLIYDNMSLRCLVDHLESIKRRFMDGWNSYRSN
jgi:hypothetical protein